MNGYEIRIWGSNYVIVLEATGEDEDDAFNNSLYTLINSEPKIDLFGQDLKYIAEFIEKMEDC